MEFEVQHNAEEASADVTVGPFQSIVLPDMFRTPLGDAAKRTFFLRSVKRINVEVSSYCNRRCGFCPNRDGTRIKTQSYLPQETFERIVNDLQSVGYSNPFFFHLYNEPLADAETLLERMRYARSRLPRSTFQITTNGDYLTPELFQQLQEAGCNRISVSVYGPGQGRWEDEYIRRRVVEIGATLDLVATLYEAPGREYRLMGKVNDVDIYIAGHNLWKVGYDRGGLVPELKVTRSSPCLSPISDANIDFRGYMLPCCNVYTDIPEHLNYTYGNLNEVDIFTAYASVAAQQWKEGLLKFNPGGPLCESCSRGNFPELDTPENRQKLNALRSAMGINEV